MHGHPSKAVNLPTYLTARNEHAQMVVFTVPFDNNAAKLRYSYGQSQLLASTQAGGVARTGFVHAASFTVFWSSLYRGTLLHKYGEC